MLKNTANCNTAFCHIEIHGAKIINLTSKSKHHWSINRDM